MIKLINLVFMIVSLLVIFALVFTINDTLESISFLFGDSVSISSFASTFENGTTEEIMGIIAVLGTSIFLIFGFPVTIFLISINGLKD